MDFIHGIGLGLMLQLSVGPVFFALLQRALFQGWREGVKMAAGVTLIDLLYMAASALGASTLLLIPQVKLAVLWGGAALLFWFGIKLLKSAGNTTPATKTGGSNSFVYGLLLTLGNPLTIVFWSGIYGSLLASGTLQAGSGLLLYSLGCGTATFLFLGAAALVAGLISKRIGSKAVKALNQLVGLILIFFALLLLYRAFF